MEKLVDARREFLSVASSEQDFSYLIDSMQPIDAQFTENTFKEGMRVRDQLLNNLPSKYLTEFDFQGSVTSDTHIRIHSDIDLLALNGCFVSLDSGAPNSRPYGGDAMAELKSMRSDAARVLKTNFPAVTVDDSPGKSISLEGGSLNRKIDVVIGNWWDTELWQKHREKRARGVRILDTKVPELIRNKPFYHNFKIDEKDKNTGGLRKVIRLLKTLKYDAEPELKMSSYDIAAVAWNMSDAALKVQPSAYLPLATNARDELRRFIDNEAVRNGLRVPNGTRLVFGPGGATIESLKQLHAELADLIQRIKFARIINFSKTTTASARKPLPLWEERRPQVILEHSY
ncbi:MAG: hypothetical protein NTZ94_00110 [Verrucomicrobia bacterium]|nr:hypothetical protein [Verrucomicrobiota bacterium]